MTTTAQQFFTGCRPTSLTSPSDLKIDTASGETSLQGVPHKNGEISRTNIFRHEKKEPIPFNCDDFILKSSACGGTALVLNSGTLLIFPGPR